MKRKLKCSKCGREQEFFQHQIDVILRCLPAEQYKCLPCVDPNFKWAGPSPELMR